MRPAGLLFAFCGARTSVQRPEDDVKCLLLSAPLPSDKVSVSQKFLSGWMGCHESAVCLPVQLGHQRHAEFCMSVKSCVLRALISPQFHVPCGFIITATYKHYIVYTSLHLLP